MTGRSDILNALVPSGGRATFDPGYQMLNVMNPIFDGGAQGDGTTKDAHALRAALATAVLLGGGDIYAPPGIYNLDDGIGGGVLQLPRDNSRARGRIRIRGAGPGATIFRLGPSAPRFLDFLKVANYDLFRNLTLEDFTIDASNVGGKHHVVMGNYQNNAFQSGLNVEDILLRRVWTINVPSDDGAGVNLRWNVGFAIKPVVNNDATRLTVKNFRMEDCDFSGGDQGGMVTGTWVTSLQNNNILLDNIEMIDCHHTTGRIPTATTASGNFFIGSAAMVGRALIQNCYGYGAGDTGMIIDNCSDGRIKNCVVEEYWNTPYEHSILTTPLNGLQTDHFVLEDCSSRKISAPASTLESMLWLTTDGGLPMGEVDIIRPNHFSSGISSTSGSVLAGLGTSRMTVKRVRVRDARVVVNGTYSAVGAVNLSAFFMDPTDATIDIDGLEFKATINQAVGSGAVTVLGVRPNGLRSQWYIDRYEPLVAYTLTGQTPAVQFIDIADIGATAPHSVGVDVRRFRPLGITGPTASLRGIKIPSAAHCTPYPKFVFDFDFSLVPLTGWLGIVAETGTENMDKVQIRPGSIHRTQPPAETAIAPNGSPFTYQNLVGYEQIVIVQGGTVSKVEISQDNSTFRDTGVTAGTFRVPPAYALKVTYSVAPTMRGIAVP